jgi:hypothetical protein
MDEIVENALSSEETFIPLSERLRRYEEEVEVKSVGNSPDKRRVQSPQSARVSPKVRCKHNVPMLRLFGIRMTKTWILAFVEHIACGSGYCSG